MKTPTRALTAALSLALLVSVAGAIPAMAATSQSSYRIKVLTNNIAGGLISSGKPSGLDDILTSISGFDPDIVTLQEVCDSQLLSFKQQFPTWSVTFARMRNHHPNCTYSGVAKGGAQGQLLASKWPMSNVTVTRLGGTDYGVADRRDPKVFKLLCADFTVATYKQPVHACTTHLRAFGTTKAEAARIVQTANIRSALASRTNTSQPVIVTGDMNSGPDRKPHDNLSKLTTKGTLTGKGAFYESDQSDQKYFPSQKKKVTKKTVVCARTLCRSGQPTHGSSGKPTYTHKLDYVYFSANSVVAPERVGGTVGENTRSDHAPIEAWADLR